jgi:small subunit ribosomal protein S9
MEVVHKIGRRKTSVARVYVSKGSSDNIINGKKLDEYFPTAALQSKVKKPLVITDNLNNFSLRANVYGGGFNGQAESVRLAISRALCEINEEYRPILKKEGLLTRDPRMVERKKYGQKKARKKFQFSKR